MALIQNEDNKCPTTKQVNDALKSMGGVQTLVLTTQNLIYPGRTSNIEVNSADSAVMEIVKSNMIDMVPFHLLYCGINDTLPMCANIAIAGLPAGNVFSLYVNTSNGLKVFTLEKLSRPKWSATTLRST